MSKDKGEIVCYKDKGEIVCAIKTNYLTLIFERIFSPFPVIFAIESALVENMCS
jgi:hypothetical protein